MKRFLFLALFMCFPAALTAQNIYISDIYISGNSITKDKIILRELPFSRGITISEPDLKDAIEKARQNLMNISLFNYVTITYQPSGYSFITAHDSLSSARDSSKTANSCSQTAADKMSCNIPNGT
ncbi:MAG: POTRA domain-containing protein, partial [Bacteroidales bacterium]|nr:POTRA domain-containing protein [Bacteroidales bacterium]